MIITGIGSRNCPKEYCDVMTEIGERLVSVGTIGRSGYAKGADISFEMGYMGELLQNRLTSSRFESYLPWSGFRGRDEDSYHILVRDDRIVKAATQIAYEIHPNWDRLDYYGRKLHTRNVYQILGRDLNTPSDYVFLYAQPKGKNSVFGGTNTALQLANKYNIPHFNIYKEEDMIRGMELIRRLEGESFGDIWT